MLKTKRLEVRVTPQEYKAIVANAKMGQVSISRYVAIAASRWVGTNLLEGSQKQPTK